jgi:hypothetical protein
VTGDAAALRQLRLRAPHRQQRVGPGTAFVGWLLISVGVGALLLAAGRHVVPGNSDGATVVLEAKAMLHGNLALSGWTLSNDSFWTVDAPFYVVALAVRGLGHALLTEVPAVIAALVAVTGMRLARDDAGGAPAWAGSLTVLALLALPVPAFAFEFVQGPLHVATTLWCLLAFALLRRGRFGPGWVGAVVLIAAGLLGDLQTLALGVFPLLAAAATAAARRRSWSAGLPNAAAAVAGAALAGGGRTRSPHPTRPCATSATECSSSGGCSGSPTAPPGFPPRSKRCGWWRWRLWSSPCSRRWRGWPSGCAGRPRPPTTPTPGASTTCWCSGWSGHWSSTWP